MRRGGGRSHFPKRISMEEVQGREGFLTGLRNVLELCQVPQTYSHDEDAEKDGYPSSLSIVSQMSSCPRHRSVYQVHNSGRAGGDQYKIASWSSI